MKLLSITHTLKRAIASAVFVASAATASIANAVTVDILVLYDNYSANYFGGDPQTAMNGWANDMNSALKASQIDMKFRIVGVRHHEEDGAGMGDVLGNLRVDGGAIALRDQLGADMVSQLHEKGACGVGYVAVDKNYTWNVTHPGCGPMVMLHEFGHNMGVTHSRKQGDQGGTRYRYGVGYGVQDVFVDIMAYEGVFNTSRVNVFSNPNLNCRGLPCGKPVGDSEEAHASLAIHNVRNELANFRNTVNSGGPVRLFEHCYYTGYTVGLGEGSYRLADLMNRGLVNDDLSSLQVDAGYRVEMFQHDNFTGNVVTRTGSDDCLVDEGMNDDISSLRITRVSGGFSQTIQAENFFANNGVQLENTTDSGGGQNVGWIDANDWMAFSNITIPTTGNYRIEYRVAGFGGTLSLDLNGGATVLGQINLPNTNGWQNWQTASHTVHINAGTYNFGIFANAPGWNINWFRIVQL